MCVRRNYSIGHIFVPELAMKLGTDHLVIWGGGGEGGAGFLSKKIFWFLICKKKIKGLKRGTKNNIASKIVKKIILDPYDGNDSILFDIFKCRWPPNPFFHIYAFWNNKLCSYNFPC